MKPSEDSNATSSAEKVELRHWEFSMQEAEDNFRVIADAAPVLIWRSGLDKLCYWFNKVWLDFTGRTMEQEMGNGWAEGVHPDDFQSCLEIYVSKFDARQPFRMEYRIKRHDGEYRWILDNGVPIYDSKNNFIGYIGSCIDITDRKNAEDELKRSNADLQRFAEVTAHHLSEPARRIATYADRLSAQLAGKIQDDEAQLSLNFIGTQSRRLQEMLYDVEQYLAASLPRGEILALDIRQTLADIEKKLNPSLPASHAEFVLGELPKVLLDKPRLNDIFNIAIGNALEHGKSDHPLVITIRGKCFGNRVRYCISDNGPGIEAQYHERVFRVFERLTSNSSGSGIGLAIIRRIAESSGGKAWIEDTPGGGCSLWVDLPSGESNE
jgi:PAS domain S-box-containing protein